MNTGLKAHKPIKQPDLQLIVDVSYAKRPRRDAYMYVTLYHMRKASNTVWTALSMCVFTLCLAGLKDMSFEYRAGRKLMTGTAKALERYICPLLRKAPSRFGEGDICCALVFSKLNLAAPSSLKPAVAVVFDPVTKKHAVQMAVRGLRIVYG